MNHPYHPAALWQPLGTNDAVRCNLCNQYCVIAEGERGYCGVRQNMGGELRTLTYHHVAAANMDPVEKKPLYHFHPGTLTFSIGTMGCNLACSFCQNYSLSTPPRAGAPIRGQEITPEAVVQAALDNNADSISYTYSEPTIFFELARDTARLAHEAGLSNIIVSNGFMTREALQQWDGLIDAANIDIKAFSETFYQEYCGARLAPVLENVKTIRELGWWLEVTTLVIPDANDAPGELGELEGLARFIAAELGVSTPWHLSRFSPTYKLTDRAATPVETLEAAYDAGIRAGLQHVYVGNVPGHDGNSTKCPGCGCVCIDRSGFSTRSKHVEAGRCAACNEVIAGVGL